jgi:2-keto-4-pentenoate hydratase
MLKLADRVIDDAALQLRQAGETRVPCSPLHLTIPADDAAAGYAIQNLNTDHWLGTGRRLVGRKIGLTSLAVQRQLGVDQPDFGMLYADMAYGDGEPIPMKRLIQPKIEGEIAFVLGRDLDSMSLDVQDIGSAVDYAVAAFEVVDSRIADWKIRLVDTLADNASSGLFVLGTVRRHLHALDLEGCAMTMKQRGMLVSAGRGNACLGNPLNALLWLATKMVEVGRPLKAGDTVLSGALGPMLTVATAEEYELEITGLGSVRAVFV